MTRKEAIEKLKWIYDQIYSPTSGKKQPLSRHRYQQLYELYEEEENRYQDELGEESPPQYGQDELNDLLDDVCAALM